MSEEYNGWTNRETWAANLWIDNERGLYDLIQQLAREEINGHDEGETINPYFLGQRIEGLFDEMFSDIAEMNQAGLNMLKDIGSLYRVNWDEIATAILDELKFNA